jgi:hypothetical protein
MADFAEYMSWDHGVVSVRDILDAISQAEENDHNEGCDDNDDENSDSLDEVMIEIERRATACGTGYPFILEHNGTVIRHDVDNEADRSKLYRYLLLSTRLDMNAERNHAGSDGTKLLEEIAAHALKNYLGSTRAQALVFGTAVRGTFIKKIDDLCFALKEGGGYRSADSARETAKDGKLDVVAWVPFADKLSGQLIIFGQCKTGRNWSDELPKLRPGEFIKKWMKAPFVHDPIRVFCISEAVDRAHWVNTSIDAGFLLDRCRLVDFSDDIAPDLLDRVTRWTIAAKHSASRLMT